MSDNEDGETSKTFMPLARVRRIMKSDGDVRLISQDAVVVVARATELFVEQLIGEAYEYTRREKRKILQYRDLAKAVDQVDTFQFLSDTIPDRKTTAASAAAGAAPTAPAAKKQKSGSGKDKDKDKDKES